MCFTLSWSKEKISCHFNHLVSLEIFHSMHLRKLKIPRCEDHSYIVVILKKILPFLYFKVNLRIKYLNNMKCFEYALIINFVCFEIIIIKISKICFRQLTFSFLCENQTSSKTCHMLTDFIKIWLTFFFPNMKKKKSIFKTCYPSRMTIASVR